MRRGVVAPPDTPDEAVNALIEAFKFATSQSSFKEYTDSNGINVDLRFGEDYQKLDEEYFATVQKYIDYLKK